MNPDHHWRQLAQLASKEADPKKLTELIGHLCDALDQQLSVPSARRQDSQPASAPDTDRMEHHAKGLSSHL